MVRTVCAPLVYTIEALASPARAYATRCSLRPPCSGKPARQDTRRGLCAEPSSNRNRPAHTLPAPRPLANACLCEALVRQARGSFDFCVVLLKNNTAALATALRGDRAGMSSGTSAAAAGRGPSDAAPAAPSGRLIFIGQVYSRRSGAHTRGILPFGPDPFAWPKTPSTGPRGAKIPQKVGTIPFRFNSQISLTQMQPPDLISESLGGISKISAK